MRMFWLTLSLACLFGLASAAAIGSTNAELLSRGAPLRRPARLFDPSKTHSLVARASSSPTTTTTATALAAVLQPYASTKKRDGSFAERDGATYLYCNPNNGRINASSTASTSYIFNDPSVKNDTIQGVVPAFVLNGRSYPESYMYVGASPSGPNGNQAAPTTTAGYITLAGFSNNLDLAYAQTNIWSYPAVGEAASLIWTNLTTGDTISLNTYIGSDSLVYGAYKAELITASGVTVTESDRVTVTFTA